VGRGNRAIQKLHTAGVPHTPDLQIALEEIDGRDEQEDRE
jgi:hypothetical protein